MRLLLEIRIRHPRHHLNMATIIDLEVIGTNKMVLTNKDQVSKEVLTLTTLMEQEITNHNNNSERPIKIK
jgi:hypothetical protein